MVGWHNNLVDMSLSKLWEIVRNRESWRAVVHGLLTDISSSDKNVDHSSQVRINNNNNTSNITRR